MLLSHGWHKATFRRCQKRFWNLRWWKFGARLIHSFAIVCCPHASEQIVNLYTDAGCGSVATVGSITYKDFSIPIGCTNTGTDASTTSLTADCNPGQLIFLFFAHVKFCSDPQTL
jgi:hypothetical protein